MKHFIGLILMACVTFSACKRAETPPATPTTKPDAVVTMQLQSTAFTEGGSIPKEFTCDGEDQSPPLSWSGVPDNAKSFVLICDDPDAPGGTWVHWVLWNYPGEAGSLPVNMAKTAQPDNSIHQGHNSFHKVGYNGPCPPPGKPHRYYFKLYALDAELSLGENADKALLEKAMQNHILAQAQLMGRYGR